MGKKWDASGIAYNVDLWKECLRVLKPGGHLLAFGGSRTEHRLTCAIEDAGFEIRDKLSWIFASGFPKSLNVSKNITKLISPDAQCVCAQRLKKKDEDLKGDYQECQRSDDGQLLGELNNDPNVSPLQDDAPEHSRVGQQKDAHDLEQDDKFCHEKLLDKSHLSNEDSSHHEEHQLKDFLVSDNVLSDNPLNKSNALLTAEHKKVDDKLHTQHLDDDLVSSSYKNKVNNIHTVYQNLPQCQVCGKYKIPQGLGTALKPAAEYITLARKPLSEPTIVKNFLKHGTGAIDIDNTKIPVKLYVELLKEYNALQK